MTESNGDEDWWIPINETVDQEILDQEITRLNNVLTDGNAKSKNDKICDKCGAKFCRNSRLKYHMDRNVCGKKPQIYHCKHCGKMFKKLCFLKTHEQDKKCNRGRVLMRGNSKVLPLSEPSSLRSRTTDKENKVPKPDVKGKTYKCENCQQEFAKKFNLQRHLKKKSCTSKQIDRVFTCKTCSKIFASVPTLQKHCRTHRNSTSGSVQAPSTSATSHTDGNDNGGNDGLPADDEDSDYQNGDSDHSVNEDGFVLDDEDNLRPQRRTSSFEETLITYRIPARQAEEYDIMYFFSNRRAQLRSNIVTEKSRLRAVKWYTAIKVEMDRRDVSGDVVDTAMPVFRSKTSIVLVPECIDEQINEAYLKMLSSFDAFKSTGSGWSMKRVIHMDQTITKFNPLRGNCSQYVIPEALLRKQCLLNVTGPPELNGECFLYAVLASLHTEPDHIGSIPWSDLHRFRNTVSFNGIKGTGRHMPVTSIPEFEKLNTISINVYGYDESFFPIYVTENFQRNHHVNLLLLPEIDATEDEVENFETIANRRSPHYCVIKDMGRLLSSQVYMGRHVHVCMRCLATKPSAESLRIHEELCFLNENHIPYIMPTDKEKWFKFRNFGRKMKVSFVIFASFGWYTAPILTDNEPTYGYEVRERTLEVNSYSYQRISVDNSYPSEVQFYRGTSPENTMSHFLEAMKKEEEYIFDIYHRHVAPMTLDDEGLRKMEASNDVCFVCKDPFVPGERIAVDHSHVSGKIRGRAHADSCNLRLKEANFVPILLQNLSQFEGRLIMQAVGRFGADVVKVIPLTAETYVSVTVNRCRFLDFSRFLKLPLGELTDSLRTKSGFDEFVCTRQHITEEQMDVAVRSQVIFNDYMDGPERLQETHLPPKEAFYDRINNRHITQSEYEQAQRFWNTFDVETLEHYLDHQLKLQSLLFADVAEHLRNTLMGEYELDCFQYFSLPGYAFDSCLHHTEVVLELLQDEEMHQTILAGIRGGVTQIGCPRDISANNPEMADYKPEEPVSYIHFFDFNSLYPSVMADFALPTRDFKYLQEEEVDQFCVTDIPADSDKGYILVVDLEYGENLHQAHDQFPMGPENIAIGPKDLSRYTNDLAERCGLKLRDERKLCLTLRSKTKYAVHYLTLQHYIKHGLVVKQIHRVIEFTQSRWLQSFVEFTINKRRRSQNSFDNILYKNMACSVFGKTIENVFRQIRVRICVKAAVLQKLVSKTSFQCIRLFSENVAAVQLHPTSVRLVKPIAVGFSILELSKLRMYKFFYEFVLKKFRDVSLVYSDTDSFLLHIKNCPDVQDILWQNRKRFDFSSLPENHPLKDDTNKQVPGKMKFQYGGSVCQEAVVLSSKCYSVLTNDGSKSTMKGISGRADHDRYKECIRTEMCQKGNVKSVRHHNQNLYHVSTTKTMMSPVETKRYYLSANDSFSHGHYMTALLADD